MFLLLESHFIEIAELLDCGDKVYVNRETGSFLSHPDFEKHGIESEEFYEEVLEELNSNYKKYWAVEQLSSNDNFEIMANFTNQLDETNNLKGILINALRNKKPFLNFKFEIDNSGEYRQKWFEFKKEQLKNWVLERYNELENK